MKKTVARPAATIAKRRKRVSSSLFVGTDGYTVKVDPEGGAVVYWEKYEAIRE